eukprot:CAMPEP_0204840966 /NCGR_PEP_ID=MMETSP1346-20131115/39847_1 /ASSEMBLY_ACC=CAM_ASM_000771 /TAXON_ID=215587 /ORGANISM="Aplanochytrium stocchinoi, Strain GSBS06" /LENGTH=123 /DNA_ID=CAMNT_0051978723 /DNA_START=57 /DNA_END=425 /DNA_ORIENTATION=-
MDTGKVVRGGGYKDGNIPQGAQNKRKPKAKSQKKQDKIRRKQQLPSYLRQDENENQVSATISVPDNEIVKLAHRELQQQQQQATKTDHKLKAADLVPPWLHRLRKEMLSLNTRFSTVRLPSEW